jgi:negative regulator of sigma E activity
MTDHHDPLDPLDDLASAHLDGETTSAEAAGVASDPQLVARIEQLRDARELVRGGAVTIDPEGRDRAIAAALAAFDAEDATAFPTQGEGAGVAALAPRSARRPSRRAIELVGIAAAVALLALAVPLLGRLDSGSNDDATATAGQTSDNAAGGVAPNVKGAVPSTLADNGAPVARLGSFADIPHLTQAVRSALSEASGYATASGTSAASDRALASSATPCPDERARIGPEVYAALAELDGQPVVVVVRDDPAGERSMVVLDANDCTTVTTGTV